MDWYSQAFEHGYSGHLTGWQWQTLFIEAYRASESPEPRTAIPTAVLFERTHSFVLTLAEEETTGFDDPYWERYMNLAMGFLLRVAELEAQGKHPKVRITY